MFPPHGKTILWQTASEISFPNLALTLNPPTPSRFPNLQCPKKSNFPSSPRISPPKADQSKPGTHIRRNQNCPSSSRSEPQDRRWEKRQQPIVKVIATRLVLRVTMQIFVWDTGYRWQLKTQAPRSCHPYHVDRAYTLRFSYVKFTQGLSPCSGLRRTMEPSGKTTRVAGGSEEEK